MDPASGLAEDEPAEVQFEFFEHAHGWIVGLGDAYGGARAAGRDAG